MRRDLRLAWRHQRAELLALGAGTLIYVAVVIASVAQLDAVRAANLGCIGDGVVLDACRAAFEERQVAAEIASMLLLTAIFVPFLIGMIMTVPIVAGDIEHRTAQLSWPMARSRVRWLIARTWPIALCTVLALSVIGLANVALAVALRPEADPWRDMVWSGRYGPLVPARALVGLGIGLVAGILVGRILPALLVGTALTAAVILALAFGMNAWRETEAVIRPIGFSGPEAEQAMFVADRVQGPDGELYTSSRAQELRLNPGFTTPDGTSQGDLSYREVYLVIPGDRNLVWQLRELGVMGVLAGGTFLGAIPLLNRRSPR